MNTDIQADVAAISEIDAVTNILEVVCRITGMGFAAVARVTEDRWVACAVRDEIAFGLKPGGELRVETTICDEIRNSGAPVMIDHVAEDSAFRGHPTPALYGFQSYISMPILRADGSFFGTLCAIDPAPAKVKRAEIVGMFKLFAELIAFHLDAHERLASSEVALITAHQAADLREQFIAVLGHDLRNPLASIAAGANRLKKEKLSQDGAAVLTLMGQSVGRMSEMIDVVLDFARARLGGGFSLKRDAGADLAPALESVIAEFRTAAPERMIEARFNIDGAVPSDRGRIARLLTNLVSNALAHGAPDQPVRIEAFTRGETFELSVANEGAPIPPEIAEQIFKPFVRGAAQPAREGLGLGLYIASEIARAHGGDIRLSSTPQETRFTFRMPLS